MTYTVIGRCVRTGNLGIGIATYSLAVGATCPWVAPGFGILSTQAFTNPDLGPVTVDLLLQGRDPTSILAALAAADGDFEYRQVGILAADGTPAIHSGGRIRQWAGHLEAENVITMGNGLAERHVIDAMAEAFAGRESDDLADRLLAALDAGRRAGGQEPSPGNHLPERSAVLLVYGDDPVALTDLRVDVHDDAVVELRRVHELYSRYVPYYDQRHREPGTLVPQETWTRENVTGSG